VTQGAHIKAPQGADDGRHGLLPGTKTFTHRIALTAHRYLEQVKEKGNKIIENDKKNGVNRDKPVYSDMNLNLSAIVTTFR
jgi:uncharacterized protein (DUF1786 family)